MGLLKAPEFGAAVTVTFPDPPDAIVKDEGLVPNVRVVLPPVPPVVVASQLEVNATGPEIWLVTLGFPTACTYSV